MRNALLILFSFLLILNSCQTAPKSNEKIVVVSILPLQYFTDQISGGIYKSIVMVPPGVGPETYSPTPKQMSGMAVAGAYFANGHIGFEEAYLEKFKAINPKLEFINTSEGVALIHSEGHAHGEHLHESGVDPHTWSSPKTAKIVAGNIFRGLVKIDPENEKRYKANFDKLSARIDSVDTIIQDLFANLPSRKFMVFHPALGYFARDYNLEQLSIEFEGKIPTPKHIQNIIEQAKAQKIASIMIQKEFDVENAEIVARETGSTVIQIDPLSYDWPGEMLSIARKMAGKAY